MALLIQSNVVIARASSDKGLYRNEISDHLAEFDVAGHMALSNTGTAVCGMEPDQLGHTHTSCKSLLYRGEMKDECV